MANDKLSRIQKAYTVQDVTIMYISRLSTSLKETTTFRSPKLQHLEELVVFKFLLPEILLFHESFPIDKLLVSTMTRQRLQNPIPSVSDYKFK